MVNYSKTPVTFYFSQRRKGLVISIVHFQQICMQRVDN